MKYKRSVFKSLAMISQVSISMLVPIALCVALGLWIDSKFNTYWVIPLMFLGMAAGFRNVYRMVMSALADAKESKNKDGEDEQDG